MFRRSVAVVISVIVATAGPVWSQTRRAVPSPVEARGSGTTGAQCRPLLIALLRDRSRSAVRTATPAIAREHLDAFIALVRHCGGELAVGEICHRSFVPLTRLHVDVPPLPPAEPVWSPNPYEQLQQRMAFQPRQRAYADALARREAAINADLGPFTAAAWPRLSGAPTCGASDVAGAVRRGLLFLDEPGAWPVTPRKVLVLVSDAQHNVGPWDVQVPVDVEVLLINGVGSRGAFGADSRVRQFEAIAAAIRYLRLHGRR